MKKLIVITAFVLLGMLANPAQATLFTGCISPGGDLKNVAEGPEPSKPCGKNDTMTQWEEPEEEPVSICPCDIGATAGWAGWDAVSCGRFDDNFSKGLELQSGGDFRPQVIALEFQGPPTDATCRTMNDRGAFIEDVTGLTTEQFMACLADIEDLAFSLGYGGDDCLF